jgi:hypothetical protein
MKTILQRIWIQGTISSSTTPVMEMLEDYIIRMKSKAKDVCHTLLY